MDNKKAIERLQSLILYSKSEEEEGWGCNIKPLEMAIKALDGDKVEVVRCKNCLFYQKHRRVECEIYQIICSQTDYCSYGVRKDD